jgi:hypothetical protein
MGTGRRAGNMNVFIDAASVLHFDDERDVSRNCPHCQAFSRMSVSAAPSFDDLLLQKPRQIGVVLRCHACEAPVFLRYGTRAFSGNRIELAPQPTEVERAKEKFAFNYIPDDVESFFREALNCYSYGLHHAFVSMCRRTADTTFADLGESSKLRLFDQLRDVRDMAEIDTDTFDAIARVIFNGDSAPFPDPPVISPYQSAVLLEVMKDFLYQAYIRRGRLQHAMKVRRFFVQESASPLEGSLDASANGPL